VKHRLLGGRCFDAQLSHVVLGRLALGIRTDDAESTRPPERWQGDILAHRQTDHESLTLTVLGDEADPGTDRAAG
jgi:hypothetical protein